MFTDKYKIDNQNTAYFLKLIDRLKDLSMTSVSELQSSFWHKAFRFHCVDWEKTSEICFNLPNEEQLVEKPWQFSVSANEHGRVHGFFIDNVFYIVWFDPEHKLYG